MRITRLVLATVLFLAVGATGQDGKCAQGCEIDLSNQLPKPATAVTSCTVPDLKRVRSYCSLTADVPLVLTRMSLKRKGGYFQCSTYPVISAWDATDLRALTTLTVTSSDFIESVKIAARLKPHHRLEIRVITAGDGCGDDMGSVTVALQYKEPQGATWQEN